ncbi:MAG: phosphatase PAP2 family protein [Candidatus Latescibacterota bacterium]|nr:MAG: phosphatase PAP2 family protein [Candidatus Latescibacterota bacterium]
MRTGIVENRHPFAVATVVVCLVAAWVECAFSETAFAGPVHKADSSLTEDTDHPQTTSPSPGVDSGRSVGRDVANVWKATTHTVTSPFRWDSRDFTRFGIFAGLTVGAVFIDEDVREIFQKNQTDTGDFIAEIGNVYGNGFFAVGLTLLTYGSGAVFGAERVRDTGMMLSDLLLTVLFVQQPLRIIVGRARPYANEGNLSFEPFTVADEYASFVSGHTWSAVGMSVVLSRNINNRWASIGLGTLAFVTAVSRMYVDKHWLSDVIMGGAFGYYSANTIVDWHDQKQENAKNLSFRPTPSGFLLLYRF